jgi:hypothetical protein
MGNQCPLTAAAMAQHVAVDEEWKAGGLASAGNHALPATDRDARRSLNKDVDGTRRLRRSRSSRCSARGPLPPSGCTLVMPPLAPPHMKVASPNIDVVPAQRHELGRAQAMAIGEQDSRRIPMAPAVAPRGLHQLLDLALGQEPASSAPVTKLPDGANCLTLLSAGPNLAADNRFAIAACPSSLTSLPVAGRTTGWRRAKSQRP